MNKKEVKYNAKSLVSTWLSNVKVDGNMWVEAVGKNSEKTVPCTKDDCGEKIGELLCNCGGLYTIIRLKAFVGGSEKIVGLIDIS